MKEVKKRRKTTTQSSTVQKREKAQITLWQLLMQKIEKKHLNLRVFLSNGTHGASPEESGDCGEEQPEIAERGERAERGGVAEGEFPTTEEGIEVLTEAIIEIADGAALHGGHAARTRLNLKDGTDMFRVDKTKCPIQMSGLTYITAQLAVQRDQDRDQEMRPQHPLHQLRLWHELCQRYLQLNVIAESQMKSRRDGSNG